MSRLFRDMTSYEWSIKVKKGQVEVEASGYGQASEAVEVLFEKIVKQYAPELKPTSTS